MYQPEGLVKIFANSAENKSSKKSKIPKTLVSFFIVLTFLFGMDFGFIKLMNRCIQVPAKMVTRIQSLLIIAILITAIYNGENKDYYWTVIIILQYITYFTILFATKITLCDFILSLYNIEESITRINRENIGLALWGYCLAIVISKWWNLYYYCEVYFPELCNFEYVPYYIFSTMALSVDMMSAVLILIYYFIYCCVKHLRELLEEGCSLRLIKKQYMAIADCYDNIRPLYDRLAGWFAYLSEGMYALHTVVFIVSAAAMVQIAATEVTALKLQLHNILIDEEKSKHHQSALRLVQYMEARRLQHDVLGVLPVDMRLPASVLGFCTTYLIVVIQFTHLYD